MSLRIVRLGSERRGKELRIGTVRRPPRGVRKEDYSKLNYYDVWLPVLSPSPELVKLGKEAADEKSWEQFKRSFKAEMNRPDSSHVLDLLAALSQRTEISIGCYCEDENHCHRSVLKELLQERGAEIS
ncbi:MAG: DUF488 family protein [Myxococcaceae bacterium]|nr:DUF488 family protein [Myxococcaceae bacterium]